MFKCSEPITGYIIAQERQIRRMSYSSLQRRVDVGHTYWRTPTVAPEIVNWHALDSVGGADFQVLADSLPALCWMARADGFIYWYNRRWHDYCGTTPQEMAGWGWQSVHDPLELPKVLERWNACIATAEAFEMVFPLRGADGEFRQFLTRISPVLDADGTVARWIGLNTELDSSTDALAVSEAKFRAMTDTLPQMIWSTRPDGFHDYYNARWYEFTGMPYGTTDGEGWNDMFHAEDREAAFAQWRHCIATGEDYEVEYRLRHHSGEYRWTLGRALPIRDDKGRIIRWIGTCTDIHESKLTADQTELMSRELSHRIKNIFAVVAGLISLSSPKDTQTARFAKELAGRISALGRAHNFARPHSVLSAPGHDFTSMHGLLTEILKPYDMNGTVRCKISGVDVPVGERSATPIALVIHELATNAMKYGALAVYGGEVDIVTATSDDVVIITWTERGGPPVTDTPEHTGFGTQLSEIGIASQLGGNIVRYWNAEGLKVVMTVPSAHL